MGAVISTEQGVVAASSRPVRRQTGLRLIVTYKLVKAALQIVGGVLLVVATASITNELRALAHGLEEHATAAWSLEFAEHLLRVSTRRNALFVGAALLVDGTFTGFEGWALHRGHAWGRWLVIIATASLLPFEAVALARHHSLGRLLLLVINALIVAYLVRSRSVRRATLRR